MNIQIQKCHTFNRFNLNYEKIIGGEKKINKLYKLLYKKNGIFCNTLGN